MKKLCFLLALFLLLTACGGPADSSGPSPEVPASAPAASPTPEAAPTARPAQTPSPGPAPLTEAEVEAAKEAALAYYAETVFEVRELTFLPPGEAPSYWEGEAIFRVACAKDGREQEPRTIGLSRQDGAWTVTREGY